MGITIAAWFTSTIYDDDFTLVVKKASEVNIMERVARPFTKTLTPGAWSMVIGTMFAVSLAMVVVEGADNVGDGIDRVMRKLNADEAALSKAGVLPGSGEEGGDEDPMDDRDDNRVDVAALLRVAQPTHDLRHGWSVAAQLVGAGVGPDRPVGVGGQAGV